MHPKASPTPSGELTTYISLYYHPGVGQTHVALCAKELQALLQISLGVVVNLRTQDRKRGYLRQDNRTIYFNKTTFCYCVGEML